MTPRIERATFEVGDRVQDKRSGGRLRAGRGVVVSVNEAGTIAEVRWDGTDHTGLRAVEFLRHQEASDGAT